MTKKLAEANAKIAKLKQNPAGKKVVAPQAALNPTGCCWTHGYKVKYGHDSKTCGTKKEGH